MNIKIKYFAAMRECVGRSEESLECECLNPRELFSFLKEKYHFDLDESHIKVAVNDEYADFTKSLSNSDTVTFIPPIAGG